MKNLFAKMKELERRHCLSFYFGVAGKLAMAGSIRSVHRKSPSPWFAVGLFSALSD